MRSVAPQELIDAVESRFGRTDRCGGDADDGDRTGFTLTGHRRTCRPLLRGLQGHEQALTIAAKDSRAELFIRIALLIGVLPLAVAAQEAGTRPARAAIIAAATDIVQKAHYCTFITIGEDGQPQARIVDPLAPDGSFTMWIATNPLTRKVDQIRRNPRVTLSCFDAATSSYVTVLGRGALISDVAEKQRHWKGDWSQIYPSGARGADVVLIRVTPARLEIVSESRGMIGDPKTWLPLSIEFPK